MEVVLPASPQECEQLGPSIDPCPAHHRTFERPLVKAGDLCVGCIVWLPARNTEKKNIKCCRRDCCGNNELDDPFYDHPVVVIKIRQRKNSTVRGDLICFVACVRDFPALSRPTVH